MYNTLGSYPGGPTLGVHLFGVLPLERSDPGSAEHLHPFAIIHELTNRVQVCSVRQVSKLTLYRYLPFNTSAVVSIALLSPSPFTPEPPQLPTAKISQLELSAVRNRLFSIP